MGDPGAPFTGRPPLPFLTRTTMTPLSLRRGAAFLHRWAALVFAPLFLVILLSGAFLACKPLWEAWQADQPQPGLTPQAWIQALETLDSRGQAGNASLSPDGQRLMLQGRSPESRKTYDARTLEPLPNQDRDWFEVAKGLHKTLLLQADPLVEAATYALTAVLALGLLLGWPRLKPQLHQWGWMDWHQGLGWLLAPLVLLTPVTAILMILHIGTGAPGGLGGGRPGPGNQEGGKPRVIALAQAVTLAEATGAPVTIRQVRRFRQGAVLIFAQGQDGRPLRLAVDAKGRVRPLEAKPGLVKQLHEGTWAGPWSGLLNLLAALVLSALLVTGLGAWLARKGWGGRRRNPGKRRGDRAILVAYASQTGTAARYGEATAQALTRAGLVATCASLETVSPGELGRHPHCLFLVASTGQGEMPETARQFLAHLDPHALQGVSFALLALGDGRYPSFCGGGARFREALLTNGGVEFLPWQTVDGDPSLPWQQWLKALAPLLGRSSGMGAEIKSEEQ